MTAKYNLRRWIVGDKVITLNHLFFVLVVAAVVPVMAGLVSLLVGGSFMMAWLYSYAVLGTLASVTNTVVLTRASQIISLQGELRSGEVGVSGELQVTKNSPPHNDK